MAHIREGGKVLLILDEWHAVLDHMLNGGTIRGRKQQAIIAAFSNLLQAIGDGNGWVIGGEAHLTQLSLDALKELSNGKLKIKFCKVTSPNPKPWKVFNYQSSIEDCKFAAFAKTKELLKQGKRVLTMLGSQEGAEQYEQLLGRYNVRRFDSDTITEPETRKFLNDINARLPDSGIQCLIASPTMGTGISIDVNYFDAVVVYSSILDPFSTIQLAGRDRNPIDRHMFVPDCTKSSNEFDPEKLHKTWKKSVKRAEKRTGITELKPHAMLKKAENITARLKALHNAGCNAVNELSMRMFASDGHNVMQGEPIDEETLKQLKQDFKIVKEVLAQQRCDAYKNAQEMENLEEAQTLLKRDDVPREKRLEAVKTLDRHKYGDKIDEDKWVMPFRSQGQKI